MDDIALVEQMLDRIAETPEEAAAAKRMLGVTAAAEKASQVWAPELPPEPVPEPVPVDHLSHTLKSIEHYEAWVASYPDEDPTSLPNRQHTLALAYRSLQRQQIKIALDDTSE